ncbi:hypothetical protein K501DRAFT_66162 [Backusella circina FSU 941]|nr:hypothetical protein K501DRAFT_66162 [Backusella circina FSU 941]
MTYPKYCCSVPPISAEYTPMGNMETWGDMEVYIAGPKSAKHAIVVFYDIFGFCDNTKQFCDILAKTGDYRVVLPDFFLGNPPKKEILFSLERPQIMEWIQKNASLPIILPLVDQVDKQLKSDGAVSGAFVGFCWGAKMSAQLSATHPFFVGASLIHPSLVDNADAEAAQIPILAIPSKQEPDMVKIIILGFCSTREK